MSVLSDTDGENLDSSCRSMTASWVRAKAGVSTHSKTVIQVEQDTSSSRTARSTDCGSLCDYFETFEQSRASQDISIPKGVYSLEDLKAYGRQNKTCPYFLTRYLINHADVIVYNYQYMLDPKVIIRI